MPPRLDSFNWARNSCSDPEILDPYRVRFLTVTGGAASERSLRHFPLGQTGSAQSPRSADS